MLIVTPRQQRIIKESLELKREKLEKKAKTKKGLTVCEQFDLDDCIGMIKYYEEKLSAN